MTTTAPRPLFDLYLRLSDLRSEEQLDGREAALRAEADRLGVDVHDVIIENDLTPGANGNGRSRPASAFKRKKIRLPNGRVELRTVRPGFRRLLANLEDRVTQGALVEDLDRLLRQPRDGEDLLDTVELSGATVRSRTGSITLTCGGTDTEQMVARIMAATANKASADTARRVRDGRQRYAGQSYGGGKRPYGFEPDPASPQYHRRLRIVAAEAAVIRQAAASILDEHVGLKPLARDLRERAAGGEPGTRTVTGAAWTPSTLRDVLLKPAVAGLTFDPASVGRRAADRELIDAPWPHILDRDTWERLRDHLTDPGRTTTPGNEPRWLVSKTATCPACGSTVRVNGVARGRAAYVCDAGGHLKRAAAKVDEYVEGRMIWRLSQPGADELLLPPPAPGEIDRAAADAELRALRKRRGEQMDLHSAGDITKADLARGMREIDDSTAKIKARLAAARRADPLKEFRGRPADVVWDALPVARKRAVIRLLADITFAPVAPAGPVFNPASVVITWKA
jgi:DNA invertase Pin-like site-specific DNA recombinase